MESIQVMPCGCVWLAYLGLSIIWDGSPRTLRFQIEDWQNRSWGFHDIDRQRLQCELAISSNGSHMNLCEHQSFRHYFIPNGRATTAHTLYLRPENAAFHIDDPARTVRGGECTCEWELLRAFPDDHECSRTAKARLSEGKQVGTGKIAGHLVVRYQAVDEEGLETELSLAPGLACEVMEEVRTWPGMLGIPGAKRHFLVTDYKPGEPQQSVFQPSPGYSVTR